MADVKVRLKDLGNLTATLADVDRIVSDSSENGTRVQTMASHVIQVGQSLRATPATHKLATLADDGKLDASQERTNAATPRGTWNASTNTPTLSDGDAYAVGDYLEVEVGAARNLGSGSITFAAGDVVKKGSGGAWYKVAAVANVLNGSATASTARTVLGTWSKGEQAGLTKKKGGVRLNRTSASNISIPYGPFQFIDGMDFTLFWNLSDVVKSAGNDYLIESHDDSSAGFEIKYDATGDLEITFYTGATYVIAASALTASRDALSIAIRVDRDGMATAFHDGVLLGSGIGVGAEIAKSFAGNTNVGRLGLSSTSVTLESTIHDFIAFNRALSDAEIAELARSGRVKPKDILDPALTPNQAKYDSDFSAGVNGWVDTSTKLVTFTGNNDAVSDGVTSKDNCLLAEPTTDNTTHQFHKTGIYDLNKAHLTVIEYYIPNTNTNVTRAALRYLTTLTSLGTALTVQGSWATAYVVHTPTVTGETGLVIEPQVSPGVSTFAGAGVGDDRIYIARVETYRLGCTFMLDGNDLAGGTSWIGGPGDGSLDRVCTVANGTVISKHGPLRIVSKTGVGTTANIQIENDTGVVFTVNEDGHIIATNIPDSADGVGLAAGTIYHDTTDVTVNGGYPLVIKG